MNWMKYLIIIVLVFTLAAPAMAGNGYMGGDGIIIDGGDSGGMPDDIDGPLNDKTSDQGDLFGDLYVILRYLGEETKNVPRVNESGDPVLVMGDWIDENGDVVTDAAGNPYQVLQQAWDTAPAVGGEPVLTEGFARYTIIDEETGEYVINELTGDIYYPAPYPSQCVQPVADYERWGDISSKTGLDNNRLPMIMTYDPTWERTECEVDPGIFIAAGETWNGVTYTKDIYYTDLIQEVSFGRLNLGRSPDAVLDHAFDEAIRAINSATNIALDASGRLLLTTNVYDEFLPDPDDPTQPLLIETVTKAIDSPLENLALYLKLMKDGHLITPVEERAPIDRSIQGGIPLWKLLGLEDGPSDALRPTIDIDHVKEFGLDNLVDASNITTYYTIRDAEGNLVVSFEPCEGCQQWVGITNSLETDVCDDEDFPFSASFLSAAADKTGQFNIDKIVYLNSILGINLVVGYSEYDENEEPVEGAIDYSKNPVYFNFGLKMDPYDRLDTFSKRGQIVTPSGDGNPATYDGNTKVLVETPELPGTWVETVVSINDKVFGSEPYTGTNISGFTKMTDDDLSVIKFIHTYQIPSLR